jgi:peptidoglycan/LPS O-acetylase OafA/YrhL
MAEGGSVAHPKLRSGTRMPSLDGLRAVSIALVLLGHLHGTRGFPNLTIPIGDYAHLGVVVFFVISGFLITTLLMDEARAHGSISIKLFYARRSLRIFPVSYVYIFVMGMLVVWGAVRLKAADVICAATYTVNYLPGRSWNIGQLWSLSVEEQFYLLWPFTFAFMRPSKRIWAVGGVLLFAVFARAGARIFIFGTPYYDLEMFPMVADSLAAGCLLAMLRTELEKQRWYLKLLRPWSSAAILALVLLLNRYAGYTVDAVLGTSLINIGLALLVHRCVYYADGSLGKILNWRALRFVGVLSYSLYVWQQPFLNRNSAAWTNVFPQNLLLAFATALTSYLLLERPMMALRSRLRRRSVANPDQPVAASA